MTRGGPLQTAKRLQLIMEYSPSPPFKSGHPSEADPALTRTLETRFKAFTSSAVAAAKKAREAW